MKLFDYDESMFTRELLEKTQALVDERQKLFTPVADPEADDELRKADAAAKDALLIGASPTVIAGANGRLQELRNHRQQKKVLLSQQNQKIAAKITELNTPVIYQLCRSRDEALRRLQEFIVFRRLTTEINSITDRKRVRCQTNLPAIEEARTVLMNFARIRNMYSHPSHEILQATRECQEQLVMIDLEKLTMMEMTVQDAIDVEETLGRRASPQFVQKLPVQQQGVIFDQFLTGSWEALKGKINDVIGGFIPKSGGGGE